MTENEAIKIARIIGTADNACSSCVGGLVGYLNDEFPEFKFELTNENIHEFIYETGKTVIKNEYDPPEDWDYFDSLTRLKIKVKPV